MSESDAIIAAVEARADEIRGRFGVSRLGVFGSRVHGEASSESDLDVLVEFEVPTFRNYMGLKRFLEEITGTKVDLVSAAAVRPAMRAYIMSEVRYVA